VLAIAGAALSRHVPLAGIVRRLSLEKRAGATKVMRCGAALMQPWGCEIDATRGDGTGWVRVGKVDGLLTACVCSGCQGEDCATVTVRGDWMGVAVTGRCDGLLTNQSLTASTHTHTHLESPVS
jgi:hypothetical protein